MSWNLLFFQFTLVNFLSMIFSKDIYIGNDGVEQIQNGSFLQPYHDLDLALIQSLKQDSNLELFLDININQYSLSGLYQLSNCIISLKYYTFIMIIFFKIIC